MSHRPKQVHHHIRRNRGATRLCDGKPAAGTDISTLETEELRAARVASTLCPRCQQNSGIPTFALRPSLYSQDGRRTLAQLYTVPALKALDDLRNCPHCRTQPQGRNCPAWQNARRCAAVLQREATRTAREVQELMEDTGGSPATLYEFRDGSVGYLAPNAPAWREAGELTGSARRRAVEVLNQPGRQKQG